jgi:hypothetical protein
MRDPLDELAQFETHTVRPEVPALNKLQEQVFADAFLVYVQQLSFPEDQEITPEFVQQFMALNAATLIRIAEEAGDIQGRIEDNKPTDGNFSFRMLEQANELIYTFLRHQPNMDDANARKLNVLLEELHPVINELRATCIIARAEGIMETGTFEELKEAEIYVARLKRELEQALNFDHLTGFTHEIATDFFQEINLLHQELLERITIAQREHIRRVFFLNSENMMEPGE